MPQDEIAQPVEEAEPCECYSWQALPQGLIWHSPMAGAKEPRFASQWLQDRRYGSFWDITLGFREGILRYGSEGAENPQGFQVDIEGAAFPRLLPALNYELMSTDFRFGIPVTFGIGAYQMKIEVYHMSDHMGDKYESLNPDVPRINFNWNALSWGNSYYVTDDLRVYGEITGAFTYSDGAKPWEFQFGVDYSPVQPLWVFRCFRGAPFFALNVDFRETVDYQPGLTVQTGWQFRGESGHLLRFGIDYFSGYSDQLEFYYQYENKFGLAVWYDF
jgi:hypothetical protein